MKPKGGIKRMKIIKNKKALSPVIAAIILIAVTVAVSIAVAAWMGALTFTFMGTEQLKITNVEFLEGTSNISVTIQNTGTSPVTVSEIWVNNQKEWTGTQTIPANSPAEITVTVTDGWQEGYNYEIKVVTSKGNQFYYTATAPTS